MRISDCFRIIILSAFLLVATGCASVQTDSCAQNQKLSVSDMIYFGTTMPGGVVTSSQWAEFLKSSVTPRFPQGFTVWRAYGQWRNPDGKIRQEESFVLSIAHPDDRPSNEAVLSIIGEYKSQFKQEAVLRVKSRACASY